MQSCTIKTFFGIIGQSSHSESWFPCNHVCLSIVRPSVLACITVPGRPIHVKQIPLDTHRRWFTHQTCGLSCRDDGGDRSCRQTKFRRKNLDPIDTDTAFTSWESSTTDEILFVIYESNRLRNILQAHAIESRGPQMQWNMQIHVCRGLRVFFPPFFWPVGGSGWTGLSWN